MFFRIKVTNGTLRITTTLLAVNQKMLFEMQGATASKRRYSEKQSAVLDRTNENVADPVAALVRKVLDREEINKAVGADDDLRASGLSSLGLVNLMLSVETEFDLKIPERV